MCQVFNMAFAAAKVVGFMTWENHPWPRNDGAWRALLFKLKESYCLAL